MKSIVAIIICLALLGGCSTLTKSVGKNRILTVSDIAYDVDKSRGYTVYIKENSLDVPYLVLTKKYNGNVLLLRKSLLDELQLFNDYSGYYPESIVDKFLNEIFFAQLDPKLRDSIAVSEIAITAESSLGICGLDTELATRKIFLLSYTEIGREAQSTACVEGIPLKYFMDDDSRIIAYRQNEATSWWLRTSYTWYDCSAFGVSPDGTVGGGGVYYENGVRPAFCLMPETPIYEDTINGAEIYLIRTK